MVADVPASPDIENRERALEAAVDVFMDPTSGVTAQLPWETMALRPDIFFQGGHPVAERTKNERNVNSHGAHLQRGTPTVIPGMGCASRQRCRDESLIVSDHGRGRPPGPRDHVDATSLQGAHLGHRAGVPVHSHHSAPLRRAALAVLLLATAVAAPLSAQDELALREENFHRMPELFDSFSFSVGEVTTFAPTNPDAYRDLVAPTLDGRLRLGIQSTHLPPNRLRQSVAEQAQRNVDERLVAATDTYLGLLALARMSDVATDENILFTKTVGNRIEYFDEAGFVPRGFVAVLAQNLLEDAPFHRYFCNDEPSCTEADRLHRPIGARHIGAGASRWGRGADEFAAQGAVESFLQSDMEALRAWSEALSPDIALVGSVEIPEYDFARQGFPLLIRMPQNSSPRAERMGYLNHIPADHPMGLETTDGLHFSAFLPMEPADAESFIEAQAARQPNSPIGVVYFVADASLVDLAVNMEGVPGGFAWAYTLTSADLALFRDARLTEPLGTIQIERAP